MKTINLKGIEVKEILLTPTTISVLYQVKDASGNVVFTQRKEINPTNVPISTIFTKVAEKVIALEGLQ